MVARYRLRIFRKLACTLEQLAERRSVILFIYAATRIVRHIFTFCILICCCLAVPVVRAKVIRNHHFRFSILVPDQFLQIPDTLAGESSVFYDTVLGTVFMYSGTEHKKFKTVRDYIDCSRKDLEQELRQAYGDTSLELVSCSQPQFYPKKTVVLHFRVTPLSSGQDTYTIYFIHHRHKDIQVSFTYKRSLDQADPGFINRIMSTMVLN